MSYYEKNREIKLQKAIEYYHENKDYYREYYQKNKEKINAYFKIWYQKKRATREPKKRPTKYKTKKSQIITKKDTLITFD